MGTVVCKAVHVVVAIKPEVFFHFLGDVSFGVSLALRPSVCRHCCDSNCIRWWIP